MSKMIDLTGKRFGDLYVLHRVKNSQKTKSGYSTTRWLCRCDCGNEIVLTKGSLIRVGRENCGCKKKKYPQKHGMSHTKLHNVWISMNKRCSNPKDTEYKNYGGRGISVCDEWKGTNGASRFIEWALKNGYKESLSIDRIDVDGNYEPSNCRWIPMNEQAFNKRNTIWVVLNGERISLKKACDILNINYYTAYGRKQKGWSDEEVLSATDNRSIHSGWFASGGHVKGSQGGHRP